MRTAGRKVRRRWWTLVLGACLLALPLSGPAVADHDGLHVPVTDALPPIVPEGPAADHRETCGVDGLRCVRFVEQELARWEASFGCDHRAVFATTYRLLTREIRLVLEDAPATFDDPAGLGWEAVLFYRMYEHVLTADAAGDPVPAAWRTALDVARSGDHTAGHDMLLGINAHVQRDMPFALAALGLSTPDGSSRKPDHDVVNAILSRAYDTIVQAVGHRYDPFMLTVDGDDPVDDLAAHQLVVLWREGVWRNAERLVATADGPLFDPTVASIEHQAQLSATPMTVGEIPGHRDAREAYCVERAAARAADEDPGAAGDPGADVPAEPIPTPVADRGRPAVDTGADVAGTPLPVTGGGPELALVPIVLAVWLRRRGGGV